MTVFPMTAFTVGASPFATPRATCAALGVPLRDDSPRTGTAEVIAPAETLSLALVTDRLGFNALEGEWTEFFARAGRSTQLFQSFAWLWHWCNHFLAAGDRAQSLAIVTGRRNGRLVLVCPFVKATSGGLSSLSFMGDPVSQYGDVLVEDGPDAAADLRAAWDFALEATGVDCVHLRKVRADAALAPLLAAAGTAVSETESAPYVAFDGLSDYADFEQRYPKAARKNRKRQLRRLEDCGSTAFERHAAGEAAREHVGLAMALKRAWLKERGLVSAAVSDPRTDAFFRDCASGRGPAAGVEVGLVRTGGEIAAIEIAIRCKERVAVHLIAYNLTFERMGAGALLMEDSVRRACESGCATLDLLAPGAGYKLAWTDRAVDVADHALGLTGAGKLYTAIYLQRMRPTVKSAIEQLPMTVRRHLSTVLGPLMAVAT